jgi:hypothetical protein
MRRSSPARFARKNASGRYLLPYYFFTCCFTTCKAASKAVVKHEVAHLRVVRIKVLAGVAVIFSPIISLFSQLVL